MPFVKSRYPENWKAISRAIRERAGQRCECRGECSSAHVGGHCAAPNGALIRRQIDAPATWALAESQGRETGFGPPVRVVLTVAHLDHDTANNDAANLKALCCRCHLVLDLAQHSRNARATRRSRKAIGELPGLTTKG